MPSREGDFHGPPGLHLAADLGQVRAGIASDDARLVAPRGSGFSGAAGSEFHPRRQVARPAAAFAQQGRGFGQRGGTGDIDPAGEVRLGKAIERYDDAAHAPVSESRDHRQQPGNRAQFAAQRELAQDGPTADRGYLLGPHEDPEGYGEIQRSPALAKLGRGQIDRDPAGRVLVAAVPDGASYAFPGFLQGGVGEPDDREAGQAGSHVDLDPDEAAVQAVQRGREKGR